MDTLRTAGGETWDGRRGTPATTPRMGQGGQSGGMLTGLAALAHPHAGLHTQRSMPQEELEEPSTTSSADALAGENLRLRAKLGGMLNNPLFADVKFVLLPDDREHGIAAEPLEVYAHRVILASGSDYFKGLFTTGASLRTVTTTVNSDGTSVQVVQLRETPWQPFLATLRYMYTAEASFDDGAAAFDVLHLAALYQGDVMKRYETEGLATCVLCIAGYGQLDALRDLCVAELVRTISPSTCVQLLHEAVLRSATDPTRYWAWLKEAAMATFRSALATTRSRTESPRVSFHDSPGSSPRPQEGAESFCAATFASLDPLVVMELLHTREILAASDETRTLLIAQCLQPWGLRHFGTATPWELLTKVAELEEVGTTPSMVYPMLPPRVKLARTKSVPSVANAVEEDDDDDDSEEPDSTAGKASSRTTSQILFAGLCTLAVSFQAGGLQFELRLRSGGDMSAGLELTVFMHMPEHTEIRKGRYGVIAAGISGLGTTVLHSQPWPFLVQMRVSLVSAQDDGRQLFSFKHCATFTDDNCRFSVPSFVPIEAIEAAAADIFDHKLPFHGDNGLRIEVCMQPNSVYSLLFNHVARDFHEVVNSPSFAAVYKPLKDTGRLPVRFLDTLISLLKSDNLCVKEEIQVLHAVLEHMRIVEEVQELRLAASTQEATPATVAAAAAALEDEFHQLLTAVRIRFVPLPQLLQLSRSNVHLQRSMLWRQNIEHLLKLAFNENAADYPPNAGQKPSMLNWRSRVAYSEKAKERPVALATDVNGVMDWLMGSTSVVYDQND